MRGTGRCGCGHRLKSISEASVWWAKWIMRFEGFGWAFPWQRRGLMTEAVVAVNDYCFDVLGFRALQAPKAVANISSRRISEKTGMRVVGMEERDYVSGRFLSEIWEISAEEWREKTKTLRNILRGEESS